LIGEKGDLMKEQTEKLIAYLNLLGIRISSDSFESRMKAQKLAYIIQNLLGKRLYQFNFYVRGPYSPELARDYFEHASDFAGGKSSYEPSSDEREKLEHAKTFLSNMGLSEFEIVAGLLFLMQEKGLNENDAELKLHELKPQLKLEDIWRGTNTIKKLFLTSELRDKIMNELKKELDAWDAASNISLKRFE